jgi:hypothetical protein
MRDSYGQSSKASPRMVLIAILGVVALIAGIITVIGVFSGFSRTDGGQYNVVRNGGPFDDNSIRQIMLPNSGLTWTGFWSTDHFYPSSQRNFKVSGRDGADSNEQINVSTSDGVNVGIEGTFYFELTGDDAALRAFDDKFGTRKFPFTEIVDGQPTTNSYFPWEEGDRGWSAMLDFTLSNVMQTIFREEVGRVRCQDLQASCALAINPNAAAVESDPEAMANFVNAVNTRFTRETTRAFGGEFFIRPSFALGGVVLPDPVIKAIDDAVAARAAISTSQAQLQQAQVDAQTNATRQQGYNQCPTCAQIDVINALPDGLTTFAPGGEFAVTGR